MSGVVDHLKNCATTGCGLNLVVRDAQAKLQKVASDHIVTTKDTVIKTMAQYASSKTEALAKAVTSIKK